MTEIMKEPDRTGTWGEFFCAGRIDNVDDYVKWKKYICGNGSYLHNSMCLVYMDQAAENMYYFVLL